MYVNNFFSYITETIYFSQHIKKAFYFVFCNISVCFNDRDDSLGTKGMGNVPVPGRCGCYREKIRYADGTFCSSSNRSRK